MAKSIPKKYVAQAVKLLQRENPSEPVDPESVRVKELAAMLHSLKPTRTKKPKIAFQGYALVAYTLTEDGTEEAYFSYEFVDGDGEPVVPSAEFVRELLAAGQDAASENLPPGEDE